MKNYIKENAIKSFLANLVVNTLIPTVILWNASTILLKDDNSTFIKNVVPPVLFSIIMTSIITFFTLTHERKKGVVALSISPNASWFPKALLNGILVGICFAILTLGLVVLYQNSNENFEIPKLPFILISAFFCAIIASLASIILAKRAAKIS